MDRRGVGWQRVMGAMVALTLSAVVLTGAQPAHAYTLQSYGYKSRTMGINTSSYVNSKWPTAITAGISAWNNAGVGANIAQGGAYSNYMETCVLSQAYAGVYTPLTWNATGAHRTTKFKIRLNISLNDESTTYKKSVVAHELGHALGLDNDEQAAALMNTGRNKEYIYSPQTDDRNGVRASWN